MVRHRPRRGPWALGAAVVAVALAVVVVTLAVSSPVDAPGAAAVGEADLADAPPAGTEPRDRAPAIAQPTAFLYSGDTGGALGYAEPGGLVIAGRENYQDPAFRAVSDGGGTVLIYLDPVIKNSVGRYHRLMFEDSPCGPAVQDWPGSPENSWGRYADLRPGGVLQQKLACVLETMVQENPHMGGWFVDDLGSRPRGTDYTSWSRAEQQAYYDGSVGLSRVFREVADRHGLVFIVNGTWEAGVVGGTGGGYPDLGQHGNALADGGVIEHHDGQQEFFGPYGCSPQWAAQSRSSVHHPVMLAISRSDADRDLYARTGCVTHAVNQSAYLDPPPPWGPFRDIGLPTAVREP